MERSDPSRARGARTGVRRWSAGLLLAAAAGTAVWLLSRRPAEQEASLAASRSPAQQAFESALSRDLEQLAQLREFQEKYHGLPREELRNTVMQLAVRGMPRLEDSLLLERVSLFSRMIDGVDVETCGAIARGRATPAQLARAVEALDPASVGDWVDLCFKAAEAELRNTSAPALDPARTRSALALLLRRFAPDEGKRLASALGNLREQSAVEACWAARTVYHQVPSLGEPHHRMLARVLAQP